MKAIQKQSRNVIFLSILGMILGSGCGIKGKPQPPLNPVAIGKGIYEPQPGHLLESDKAAPAPVLIAPVKSEPQQILSPNTPSTKSKETKKAKTKRP